MEIKNIGAPAPDVPARLDQAVRPAFKRHAPESDARHVIESIANSAAYLGDRDGSHFFLLALPYELADCLLAFGGEREDLEPEEDCGVDDEGEPDSDDEPSHHLPTCGKQQAAVVHHQTEDQMTKVTTKVPAPSDEINLSRAMPEIGSRGTLPSLDEIGPIADGDIRNVDEMLLLAMIPNEDTGIRAAAVALFKDDEATGNSSKSDVEKGKELLLALSQTHARTPGGIAWKVATAFPYFKDPDEQNNWSWAHYLLRSVIGDLLEIERRRTMSAREERDIA